MDFVELTASFFACSPKTRLSAKRLDGVAERRGGAMRVDVSHLSRPRFPQSRMAVRITR